MIYNQRPDLVWQERLERAIAVGRCVPRPGSVTGGHGGIERFDHTFAQSVFGVAKRHPKTGYLFYARKMRPVVKIELAPYLKFGASQERACSAEITKRWLGLTEETRALWNTQAVKGCLRAVLNELLVERRPTEDFGHWDWQGVQVVW